MDGVFVAIGTELFKLDPGRGIATVFLGGVTGHPRLALLRIGPTLGTFQGDNDADTFSHRSPLFLI